MSPLTMQRHRFPASRQRSGAMDYLAALFASSLYVGYIPFASGTWGSLWGVALFLLLSPGLTVPVCIVLIPVLTVLGAFAAGRCEQFWGEDPSRVVMDETVGMLVTLFMVPYSIPVAVAGFFLFRFYDIVKPPPVRQAEHLHGGWGVMADDILAGVYANLSLRLLILIVPALGGSI
jgi:phosphatidylglycerophosphatase A